MKKKGKVRDMHETEVDFGKIQDQLFNFILEEDPGEAKKLGLTGGPAVENTSFGVGKLDDNDADAGLEA